MTSDIKGRKVNRSNINKEFSRIDKLFSDLKKDKSLPTFGEHYLHCLMFGIAEKVNLKKMYPELFVKLSKWLKEHDSIVIDYKKQL